MAYTRFGFTLAITFLALIAAFLASVKAAPSSDIQSRMMGRPSLSYSRPHRQGDYYRAAEHLSLLCRSLFIGSTVTQTGNLSPLWHVNLLLRKDDGSTRKVKLVGQACTGLPGCH
ncbi:hypothetical protein BC826DRAFT_1147027 [Russula brevipes]|nr:hypothetical protein BC826DRAFT_1147027 [Russula brevipes]